MKRLDKIYGKNYLSQPIIVRSENNVWDVCSKRVPNPKKIVHVKVNKSTKNCEIKSIIHYEDSVVVNTGNTENFLAMKQEIECNPKKQNKTIKYACSSSEARSSALRRLWKIYGKKDIRTPYQVISENQVWVVKGSRHNAPSKIVQVIISKKSKNCAIKEIFHKRRIYSLHSRTPSLKKASDYKCPSHIVSQDTCKKLTEFQNR